MARKKEVVVDENVKYFHDITNKNWVLDEDSKEIKIGNSVSEILKNEFETIHYKELMKDQKIVTWQVAVSTDDNIYLLRSSRLLT